MKKVAIIGCCGSGKTVLAKNISKISGLPVFHLDDLFWHESWVTTEMSKWRQINEELITKDQWIIDGTYSDVLENRIKNADTVIFLDLPLCLCFFRVVRRNIRNYFGWEKSLPKRIQKNLEVDKYQSITDGKFYRYVLRFKKNFHPIIYRLISELRQDQQVIKLSSRKEVYEFMEEFKKSSALLFGNDRKELGQDVCSTGL